MPGYLRKISLTTWLLISGFVSLCVVSVLIIVTTTVMLRRSVEEDATRQIDTNLRIAWLVLHDLGPELQIKNGQLYAGATLLNNNSFVVDKIHNLVGGVVTIFQGDVRVTTDVLGPDGRRGVGTHLAVNKVRQRVISELRPFRGVVDVLGQSYYSGYDPIFDASGKLIGILYVGSKQAEVLDALSSSRALRFYIPAAAIGLVGAFFLLLGSKITQQIRKRQEALETAHSQLDTALASMPNGLSLWSPEERLLLFNKRLCEVLDLSPTLVRTGMSYQDFLAARHEVGNFSTSLADVYAGRYAIVKTRQPGSLVDVSKTGRVVNNLHRPTSDGGWVFTYEDITERHQADQKITFMARHDGLTGLANRTLFRETLEATLKRAERVFVFCLDLDKFKRVNDTLGHAVGDEVLRALSKRFQHCIRAEDMVARLGGDEFGIIQVGGKADAARSLAGRIIQAASQPIQVGDHKLTISTCIGISEAGADSHESGTLLKNADVALYSAKADGCAAFRFFDADLGAAVQKRRELETELREALAHDQLRMFYQPLVTLQTGLVSCFEALMRWEHPTRGMVPPAEFIPVAEEIGLISAMGAWSLSQACFAAMTWPSQIKVAVNLSAHQFQSGDLVMTVRGALEQSGLPAERLELEVTESVLLFDTDAVNAILRSLRDIGVRIVIDDFGTGYSSLAYLRQFPFDKIKIDQSFIRDADAHAIVRAITGLALSLRMETVAEGVETSAQLQQVYAEGCTEVQGYLFSKPQPAAKVREMLTSLRPFTASARGVEEPETAGLVLVGA